MSFLYIIFIYSSIIVKNSIYWLKSRAFISNAGKRFRRRGRLFRNFLLLYYSHKRGGRVGGRGGEKARLSTTVVLRSRQEDGASCRLLALIVSRQVARADACLAVPFHRRFFDHGLLPRSLLPTLLSPSRPPSSLRFPLVPLACLPPCRQIGQQTADYYA